MALVIVFAALAAVIITKSSSTGYAISGNSFLGYSGVGGSVYSGIMGFLGLGGTWQQVIISIIVFVIIFAGFYDILELVSIFNSGWVKVLISIGLAVIAALVGLVNAIATALLSLAAGIGAVGIAVEIVISVIIFIGISFGSVKLAMWGAKRKYLANKIKTLNAAGDVKSAITGLREVEGAFKESRKGFEGGAGI